MQTKLSKEPVYNIKSVSAQTGIPPVTLRAWERRYGYPEPQRTDSGYRLYSEYDVAALNWLKMETDKGLAIGRAVKLLQRLIEEGQNPLVKGLAVKEYTDEVFQSIEQIQPALVRSLLALDEAGAHKVMEAAFSLYTVEQVLLEVIQPTMIEIGERWHAGEISIGTEHFSTQICRQYLMNALDATKESAQRGRIVAACAPGEWHEIGLLMLTILLRWRDWAVIYLGANLGLERLHEVLEELKPQMLLFSATSPAAARNLRELIDVLDRLRDPKPIIGLGGQAFRIDPTLTNQIPGTFLGPEADDAIRQIETLLKDQVEA